MLFLGSSIGNFDPPAAEKFLRDIRRHLRPGDALLLGTDVEKSVDDMLLAYDDPTGVTAAFNLNLLARINRELGGDFHPPAASNMTCRYQDMDRRIEMHLRSTQKPNRVDPGRGLYLYLQRRGNDLDGGLPQIPRRGDSCASLDGQDSSAKRNGSIPNGRLPRTF